MLNFEDVVASGDEIRFRDFDAQAERSEYEHMVVNAASQNGIWVMAMQNFKTWEPLILEHAPKFQPTLALLQDENRENNEGRR